MDDMSAQDLLAAAKGRLSVNDFIKESKEADEVETPAKSGRKSPKRGSPEASAGEPPVGEEKAQESTGPLDHEGDDSLHTRDDISAVSHDTSDEEEEEETDDVSTGDLLAAVRGRMEQQKFMDEVKDLKRRMEEKDDEIATLKSQLQMALSTKQSLLIANSELEQRHEQDMEASQRFEEDLRTAGRVHMDVRAEIEKDFMNDLVNIAKKLQASETTLSEKEDRICRLEAQLTQYKVLEARKMCGFCKEKEEIIHNLQERLRAADQNGSVQNNNQDKVQTHGED